MKEKWKQGILTKVFDKVTIEYCVCRGVFSVVATVGKINHQWHISRLYSACYKSLATQKCTNIIDYNNSENFTICYSGIYKIYNISKKIEKILFDMKILYSSVIFLPCIIFSPIYNSFLLELKLTE